MIKQRTYHHPADFVPVPGGVGDAPENQAPRIAIEVSIHGRSLEATATAPAGYSWDGLHQLVESWAIDPTPIVVQRAAIRRAIKDRLSETGSLRSCPVDCECRE